MDNKIDMKDYDGILAGIVTRDLFSRTFLSNFILEQIVPPVIRHMTTFYWFQHKCWMNSAPLHSLVEEMMPHEPEIKFKIIEENLGGVIERLLSGDDEYSQPEDILTSKLVNRIHYDLESTMSFIDLDNEEQKQLMIKHIYNSCEAHVIFKYYLTAVQMVHLASKADEHEVYEYFKANFTDEVLDTLFDMIK